MRYFCADLHFGHFGALTFGKRPWTDVESMNEGLIENWNSRVTANDECYVLGDFAFRHEKGTLATIFHRLRGKRILVKGNHDAAETLTLPWTSIHDYKEISVDGHNVIMSHYPMRSWNKMFRGSYHLFGHEHGNVVNYSHHLNEIGKGGSCDVGVDSWNWHPVTFAEIIERIQTTGEANPDLFDADGNDRTKRKDATTP